MQLSTFSFIRVMHLPVQESLNTHRVFKLIKQYNSVVNRTVVSFVE